MEIKLFNIDSWTEKRIHLRDRIKSRGFTESLDLNLNEYIARSKHGINTTEY